MTTGQLESKSDAGLTALPASSACAQLCRSAEIICPSVILIGIDIEGHILWMNEQARAVLYGLPPTHKTDTIFQLIETVDHPALTSNLRTLVRTCVNAVQIAFHLKTPMGKAPYLRGHIITTPKNPDGTDTYVISVHAVTPYSSEDDHFHKIIHQALEATIVHRDGKVLYANQKSADIFGVEDHQKMLDIPDFHSFIHPHDKDLFEQRDNHTKSEGISSEEFECRLISEKEKITWVRCRIGTIMWNGRPATVTTFIDITDKKSEEHAQREREKLFTRILEISPDVVAISDCESGEYLWVNTAFSKFFGIPAKEVYGRTSLELGIWHSPEQRAQLLEILKEKGVVENFEARAHLANGQIHDTSLAATKIRFMSNDYIVTVGRDITQQKRQQKDLENSIVAAELANRSKTDFLTNMSHELRTPLNAIIGFSSLISEQVHGEITAPKYIEYADDIQDAGRHLLHIVNDLLDMSRIEAGKIDIYLEAFDILETYEQIERLLRERIIEEGLKTTIHPPSQPLLVWADISRTKQIMINLLSNAIKFTPKGGEIHVFAKAKDDGSIAFSIKDTGIGMTEDEIVTALSPFGQSDTSYTRHHDGIGLGIPIVENLTTLQNGTFSIRSKPGEGTTVTITLPQAS